MTEEIKEIKALKKYLQNYDVAIKDPLFKIKQAFWQYDNNPQTSKELSKRLKLSADEIEQLIDEEKEYLGEKNSAFTKAQVKYSLIPKIYKAGDKVKDNKNKEWTKLLAYKIQKVFWENKNLAQTLTQLAKKLDFPIRQIEQLEAILENDISGADRQSVFRKKTDEYLLLNTRVFMPSSKVEEMLKLGVTELSKNEDFVTAAYIFSKALTNKNAILPKRYF